MRPAVLWTLAVLVLAMAVSLLPAEAQTSPDPVVRLDSVGMTYLTTGGQLSALFNVSVPAVDKLPVIEDIRSVVQFGVLVQGNSFSEGKLSPALTTSLSVGGNPAVRAGVGYVVGADTPWTFVLGDDLWQPRVGATTSLRLNLGQAPTPVVTDPGIWLSAQLRF